ncbi:hypothetical protein QFZ81_003902 [Paenibacillus sp. V4I9]|uniref:hypothetical protein n=1 Tax=Paenibacillus sp. V4I9 TaxID=3042308 RepID=UPI0027804237|nr:hypothetical protein [Paenibacillus sp. V4I9]MDQ0888814.1 hypothetical protein [Paenibacillus sp. V4I9]
MFWKGLKNTIRLELCVFLIVFIAIMSVFENSVIAAPSEGELKKISPYDPYVAPHENIALMKEAMLFEFYSRIEKAVILKFGNIRASSYEIAGVRKDGHGGFNVKVTGYVEHGAVVDYVEIILGSPHFGSELVVENLIITGTKKKVD